MMSLLPFWALNVSVVFLSMEGLRALGFQRTYRDIWWPVRAHQQDRDTTRERTIRTHGTERALERILWAHGTERAVERTLWAHGMEWALERTIRTHGTEQALERILWAHGTERALERTLWAHGMERALEQTLWVHGTERALERTGMGTAALGGASLGRPAARTDLMGGSSSLRTSPGTPGCAAASPATT